MKEILSNGSAGNIAKVIEEMKAEQSRIIYTTIR